MWPRFNRNDLGIISHYLGMLMMVFGLIMVLPLVVGILNSEWAICTHYVLGIGVAFTLGALLRLAKITPQRMGRKHAIAITGMVWIVGALIAAVPLYLSGQYADFLDALFEGVSGLTATGLSLARDVNHMSMADNMWRFSLQFIGGQGVVVVALSLGIFTRTGNALYSSEAREESVVPSVKNTARFILQFSSAAVLIGTIISSIAIIVLGVDPMRGVFQGLWLTIAAYDTGGFAASSLSLIPYHSWPLEVVTMILMMFGALSFAVVAQVNKGNWREFVRDIEVRTLAIWTVGMVIIFVAALAAGNFLTDYSGLMRRGIFTIISATTNTGFQVLTTPQITTLFSSGALLLLAVSMAVGGSSASTAGGIKALRVGLIFKGIGLYIRRILQPRSAHITASYNHIGRHQLAPEMLSSALIIASLYVISYVVGALVGIAYGYEALHATFESISAASNAGISSGIVQAGMPVPLEVVYILQMWLGRLEFITLLALFASLIASFIPRRKPKSEGPRESRGFTSEKDDSHSKANHTKGHSKTLFAVVSAALLAVLLILAPIQSAYAETTSASSTPSVTDVTVGELAAVPAELDGATVSFEGEVVGDCIDATEAEYVWITMSDGSGDVTVYLSRDYLDEIEYFGSYAYEGTQLEVMGEYHVACSQHDGSSDVHVTSVMDVVSSGGAQEHPVNPLFLIAGAALIAVAVVLIIIYNVLSGRRR